MMDSKALCFLTLSELSGRAAQARGHLDRRATRAVLDRIHHLNPTLRAYLTVLDEPALRQAEAADKAIAAGQWRGPLHGVPVAVKDRICWTKGVPMPRARARSCAIFALTRMRPWLIASRLPARCCSASFI